MKNPIEEVFGEKKDSTPTTPRQKTKVVKIEVPTPVPYRVVKAWNNLEGSIASVFRESKWPAKFALFEIFKDWYDKLPKEE